jgi:hypothetical protein
MLASAQIDSSEQDRVVDISGKHSSFQHPTIQSICDSLKMTSFPSWRWPKDYAKRLMAEEGGPR